MKINPISNSNNHTKNRFKSEAAAFAFCAKQKAKPVSHDPENPISKTMERLDLMKAAVVAGLGFAARALFEFDADGELTEGMFKLGKKVADKKYSHLNGYLRTGLGIASGIAIITGTIGLIAGIYAACQTPKAMYQGGINAHKKSEEMDVYLAQNRIEQDLYKQVTENAKQAQTKEDLGHAEQQYMLLKQAKTQIPAFMNNM